MRHEFWRVTESCWFDLPTFDFLPFIKVTVQIRETVGIKYGATINFGWLLFQYRLRIYKAPEADYD